MSPSISPDALRAFEGEVSGRLARIAAGAADGELDGAIAVMAEAIGRNGVIQAFGTGHSEAFAMEIAGRAGGLIPTNKVCLRDAALYGDVPLGALLGEPPLERDPSIAARLFATIERGEDDVFIIASNSGVNGSVVGLALLAKEHGHPVIAVTSLEHTASVQSKHPSGLRLSEVADVVLDNRAPSGDATLQTGAEVAVGAVSSLTSAFIAQLLTIGVEEQLRGRGSAAPVYLSANLPGGHERNKALEARYGTRLRRSA